MDLHQNSTFQIGRNSLPHSEVVNYIQRWADCGLVSFYQLDESVMTHGSRPLHPQDVTESYVEWLNDSTVNQYLEARHDRHTLDSVTQYVSYLATRV